ncbi:hypothetical protein QUH73_06060 [Labilibaculum sp. K2S]|uniref:hypothetical protein n=1 Tax=Labilibaculum sp. K2S TaxID=3056386 RepID=UPI0025A4A61D|nr:hypothetical protein [Labilibaculum sp. K2S]MDM8159371.1 hypothetical protein [Labilibaculum sp. K2S]
MKSNILLFCEKFVCKAFRIQDNDHFFAGIVVVATIGAFVLGIAFHRIFAFPVLLYAFLVFTDALTKSKSFAIAIKALAASFVQMFAYGIGFMDAVWKHKVLRKDEFGVFGKGFYE